MRIWGPAVLSQREAGPRQPKHPFCLAQPPQRVYGPLRMYLKGGGNTKALYACASFDTIDVKKEKEVPGHGG